jgi:predicted nucleotidyltransferase
MLTDRVLDRLEKAAADMEPAPVSMVLFGSFVRGEADKESDIDVLCGEGSRRAGR